MSTPSRPAFGSERELAAWEHACNVLALAMTSDYAVAPQSSIVRADGRVLGAGAPVSVADFEPALVTPTETIAPRVQLDRAVAHGAVLVRGRRYAIQHTGGDGPAAA